MAFVTLVGKKESPWFWGGQTFQKHAPKNLSAAKMDCFLSNSREMAQIVSGENVGSMHVKRSDPEKD